MSTISPEDLAPGGCSPSYAYDFNIQIQNITDSSSSKARRSLMARQDALTITLTNGVLTDSQDRIGYISSEGQFQFDSPTPDTALYTAGFSACTNGSLAIGGSAMWYSCLVGDFYNLYYRTEGEDCYGVTIDIINGGDGTSASASATASSSSASPLSSLEISAAPSSTYTAPFDPLPTSSGESSFTQGGDSSDSSGGLSTGATAGIAVAVAVVGIAALALAFVFLRRRRRNRTQERSSTPPYARPQQYVEKSDGAVYEKDGRERQLELDGGEIHEAGGKARRSELPE